ncbi:MAG: hypothetical protein KDK89_23545 [Alphaproteobacteria bacterium]|nr:hypothetical protein [Alphaproteobacteria bacterium]
MTNEERARATEKGLSATARAFLRAQEDLENARNLVELIVIACSRSNDAELVAICAGAEAARDALELAARGYTVASPVICQLEETK